MRKHIVIAVVGVVLCLTVGPQPISAQGESTFHVPADFLIIQDAINAASSGDTIIVADGTHTGPGNKNLDFGGKSIILKSAGGAANCIIDCESSGRGFYFHSGETSDAIVDGFTIRNGSVAENGGGIYCRKASPTIINCIIENNSAGNNGGGIYCHSANPNIINCLIVDSSAGDNGGGLYCQQADPTLTNCTITNNSAESWGGGLWCHQGDVVLNNTIIWGNNAGAGGDQICACKPSTLEMNYCDFADAENDVEGKGELILDSCINEDPLFVDAQAGDYHLQGASPCIDAGNSLLIPADVTVDLDGRERVWGTNVDLGPYEFQPVIYVNGTNGDDSNDGFSWATAVWTIQRGIDRAIEEGGDGWTVLVADGTYTGTGNKDLDFQGFAIHLKSVGGAQNCIIDCENIYEGRGIHFHSGETSASIVEGFTIQNGSADYGGGILCENGSSPTITNCVITDNSADFGGGIWCWISDPIITNCTITNNSANRGGGVFCSDQSNPIIRDCTVSGNTAWFYAGVVLPNGTMNNCTISNNSATYIGGLYCAYNTTITNCTISNNSADYYVGGIYCTDNATIANCTITGNSSGDFGGGVYCLGGSPTITNCVITSNETYGLDSGGGIYCQSSSPTITNCTIADNFAADQGGGIACFWSALTVNNTIIWGNTATYAGYQIYLDAHSTVALDHCCYPTGGDNGLHIEGPGIVTSANSIHDDPLFVDAEGGDYHLLDTSPCIDAGDNTLIPEDVTTDLDGNPRIMGEEVDIGAYEFPAEIPNTPPNPPTADDILIWNELDETGNPIYNPAVPMLGFITARATDDDPDDTFQYCQVQVSTSEDFAPQNILWDSEMVDFPSPVPQSEFWPKDFLPYTGPQIEPESTIYIRVKVWDDRGGESDWSEPKAFEFGPLDPDYFTSHPLRLHIGVVGRSSERQRSRSIEGEEYSRLLTRTLDNENDEEIFVAVGDSVTLECIMEGWAELPYRDATVVQLVAMYAETELSGELTLVGEPETSVVGPIGIWDGITGELIGYYYSFYSKILATYHSLEMGTDLVYNSAFFKQGKDKYVTSARDNEIRVVINLPPPGITPVPESVPGEPVPLPAQVETTYFFLFNWLLSHGFDLHDLVFSLLNGIEFEMRFIHGQRENEVGNFRQAIGPHNDGRLFIDTKNSGTILATRDKQSVLIRVELRPDTLDPAKFMVRWEARDPDDPATSPHIDGNGPDGGDNSGNPHEKADHWFTQLFSIFKISDEEDREPDDEETVIGEAKTTLHKIKFRGKDIITSTVRFNYSDDGGDNFKIKAVLVKLDGEMEEEITEDESGKLTVWRQRLIKVHAMTKPNDDEQLHPVGATPGAFEACILPGDNEITDTMILGGDDERPLFASQVVSTGANGIVETTANSGGNSFYPSDNATKNGLVTSLRTAFASSDANHAAYIDFIVKDGRLNLPHELGILALTTEWSEYLDTNLHGADKSHPDNTYDVIGIAQFMIPVGVATQRPHVGVGVWYIKLEPIERGVDSIVLHELGHVLTKSGSNTHDGHTDGDTQTSCAFERGQEEATGLKICEKHCKMLRENITRSWPDHVIQLVAPAEESRDSDQRRR